MEWEATLRKHVFPGIGGMRVDRILPRDVARALHQVWRENASARRILERVHRIMDRAVALGYRTENPATWSLQQHLLGQDAGATGEHHAAIPWQSMPAFMAELRGIDGVEARALEFLVLTVARSAQVIGSRKKGREIAPMPWAEVDPEAHTWTIAGSRMKKGVTHVVPLCRRAAAILEGSPRTEPVFEVSNDRAMLQLVKRYGEFTSHGLRSSFQDWAAENGWDQQLVDFALSHSLPDKTTAAYYRTTRVAERAKLMQAWCDFLNGPVADNVVQFRA
jgi:integrase